MREADKQHKQALDNARMAQRPYSVIRFANNGQFELCHTYHYKENSNGK